jgi:hypothetical protein
MTILLGNRLEFSSTKGTHTSPQPSFEYTVPATNKIVIPTGVVMGLPPTQGDENLLKGTAFRPSITALQ